MKLIFSFAGFIGMLFTSQLLLADGQSSLYYESLGGRIYDKWYAEIDVEAPKDKHPLYPSDGKYADKAKSNWRCKECHGWDYQGKDGAYSSGKHYTGIAGLVGKMYNSVDQSEKAFTGAHGEIAKQLKPDQTKAVAQFLTTGLFDMDTYIDRASKRVNAGDVQQGQRNYENICARCHGLDGKEPDDMDPFSKQMAGNPWEVMHKILNGQPTEQMPAFKVLGLQFVMDTMAYMETFPKE